MLCPRCHRPNFASRSTNRTGFTLLEVALTAALIAGLTALLWPTLESLAGGSPADRITDRWRATLLQLRIQAIEAGQPYHLTIQPRSGNYHIAKGLPTDAHSAVNIAWAAPAANAGQTEANYYDAFRQGDFVLPEKLTFRTQPPAGKGLSAEVAEAVAAPMTILFLPDGSCNSAKFDILDTTGYGYTFDIHGLTGRIRVKPKKSADGQFAKGPSP